MTALVGKTTVVKAHSTHNALRTTIPISIVKQWQLEAGDELEWNWIVVNTHMVMTVKKAK